MCGFNTQNTANLDGTIRREDESMEDFDKRWKSVEARGIDPYTGVSKTPPKAPDLTDEAIKKARTSALMRLQTGKNRTNSFAVKGNLGGFDVAKPVLGGY